MKIKCQGHKPKYANEFAAGLDIKSNNTVTIYPNTLLNRLLRRRTKVDIDTKLAVEILPKHFGMLVARSGLAFNHQVKLINDIGIIDEDYRGDIGVRLVNEGNKKYHIEAGDRVAQLIIIPYKQVTLEYTDDLEDTERGEGGFGHTGR